MRLFSAIVLSVGAAPSLGAQGFPPTIVPSRWEGAASLGASLLKIGLSIEAGPKGLPDARVLVDVPESAVLRNPAAFVAVTTDSVRFSISLMGALVPFAGVVHGNQMDGSANMGQPIPVHLTRVAIPTLPYRIEEITARHDSIRLAASLYLPTT